MLVRKYRKNDKPRLDALLAFYRSQSSLRDAVHTAGYARNYDCKKHSHQSRTPQSSLQKVRAILQRKLSDIYKCESFDELHQLVERTTEEVRWFGELAVYDTALRIGAYIGVYPRKIYLHRGTRGGCRKLQHSCKALRLDLKCLAIDVIQLPRAIRNLQPWEIEDFLCIYKNDF